MDFRWAIQRTPEELNFPKFGKYPERDSRVTTDFHGRYRSVSQKHAPPLDKTVLKLKRLLEKPELSNAHKPSLFPILRIPNFEGAELKR
jgi:hypothetical protein